MALSRKYTDEQNRGYIEKWCARRERAPVEVKRKLRSRGMAAHVIDSVIDQLKNDGFVDEDRFARAYTRDKYRLNKWGINKIAAGLRSLQIDDAHIHAAREDIDRPEYLDHLRGLRDAKLKQVGDVGAEGKQKIFRYLCSRGYTSEEVSTILAEERR